LKLSGYTQSVNGHGRQQVTPTDVHNRPSISSGTVRDARQGGDPGYLRPLELLKSLMSRKGGRQDVRVNPGIAAIVFESVLPRARSASASGRCI